MRSVFICLLVIWASMPGVASVQRSTQTCLPTCDQIDGRFLVLAGTAPGTMAASELVAALEAPASSPSLSVGLFDGDAIPAATGATPVAHWDIVRNNRPAPGLALRLTADAEGRVVVRQWSAAEAAMADNAWTDLVTPHDARAKTDSGYRYWLTIRAESAADQGWNVFKLRSEARLTLPPQSISFVAAMTPPVVNTADALIIYPDFPDRGSSTYDGTWTWHFVLPAAASSLAIWDGDWDFGDAECQVMDTDDPDSPPGPPFDRLGAADEGVATGVPAANGAGRCGQGRRPTGDPPEDGANANFRRVPRSLAPSGVAYAVEAPDGSRWVNRDPSGNREWEQFNVPGPMERGQYRLLADGVDLLNLNLIRLPHSIIATVGSSVM